MSTEGKLNKNEFLLAGRQSMPRDGDDDILGRLEGQMRVGLHRLQKVRRLVLLQKVKN